MHPTKSFLHAGSGSADAPVDAFDAAETPIPSPDGSDALVLFSGKTSDLDHNALGIDDGMGRKVSGVLKEPVNRQKRDDYGTIIVDSLVSLKTTDGNDGTGSFGIDSINSTGYDTRHLMSSSSDTQIATKLNERSFSTFLSVISYLSKRFFQTKTTTNESQQSPFSFLCVAFCVLHVLFVAFFF